MNYATYFTYKGNDRKMLCGYSSTKKEALAMKASLLSHPDCATSWVVKQAD